ncbi:GNAT family N-acetyltransferase [Sphingomonas xinjiangensis]|uniref:RimJ/RimL family protein N-acetyltransferase n=1 Tax=Sphingomonas xinjiangensis TaxID=643568 RepID=A0A840YQN7_9SPHN|nr:GNAT family N-acetyltransferase [Sphingomonas xinjiangensis]MBB5711162.1 RimJ/RimL family protein N-acetyltransferase [Sphingomonas xinjiangensis]
MDLQPTLVGERVLLRPTVAEDWAGQYAVASDPLIWELHPARDRWQEAMFRRFFEEALASGGGLTIIDRASGTIIGASRYCFPDPVREEVEIGYTFLAREHWGGAVNREVKQLMLGHIHRFVPTAIFVVGENNLRSRRAMDKIGGVLQPRRVERGNGQMLHDHVFYAVRRAEG